MGNECDECVCNKGNYCELFDDLVGFEYCILRECVDE